MKHKNPKAFENKVAPLLKAICSFIDKLCDTKCHGSIFDYYFESIEKINNLKIGDCEVHG